MPTTSHTSTNPSNTQYHCTTHISLTHTTNFTYAKNNHAQMYAPTASCLHNISPVSELLIFNDLQNNGFFPTFYFASQR